ncbi:acetate--CoA ligase family protein [Paraburkholderia guartelaensis]|uniref:acetate--CoA ligase family protein n=1 Tax=Paraburkholderia guartelaensis TaxID=2546446 RepID=UPI002AB5E0FF|nr:acetate--CoA ligase family protein [Paraburkholderia guartelaensis]
MLPTNALLNPGSVAVVGASDDPTRIGGRPIEAMRRLGFAGRVFPVNPHRSEVQGLPAYASIAALPETPHAAIVAVPAPQALEAVQALAERGVRAAIVFSAGFAETGAQGGALQASLATAASRGGMRLLGPNALGCVNFHSGFAGSFLSTDVTANVRPGNVGIASQSGAYGGHLLAAATDAGVGISSIFMTGNEADFALADVVHLMVEDPDTTVIALYAEGIQDGPGLLAALDAARRARKPVVMLKVGRSALGSAAALSHTASIVGDAAVCDAVLAEAGVVRASTTEALLDIVRLATRGIFPERNTLGMITVSGGAGVIVSDAAEALKLPMPELPEQAQHKLLELLPICSPRNPVDTTGQFINDPSIIEPFVGTMLDEGGYRTLLGFFTYAGTAPNVRRDLLERMARVRARHQDRLYVLILRGPREALDTFETQGFTVFEDLNRAVVAIAAMGQIGRSFAADAQPGTPVPVLAPIALPPGPLSEAEAKRLLADAGVACVPERACADAESAVRAAREFGFPVVMKILSPDILHKSEAGGVLLGVSDESAVRSGFSTLLQRARHAVPQARLDGVLVARQILGGVECIMGIQRDPVFGPIAMFGLGGIFVEILNDVVLHRCPFGVDIAEQMIRSIRGAPLLLGARGCPVADIAALARMLSRLSAFALAAGPRLQSLDLNPVFAMPEGEGALVADAAIVSDPAPGISAL